MCFKSICLSCKKLKECQCPNDEKAITWECIHYDDITIKEKHYCDNTDCVSKYPSVTLEVILINDFGNDKIYWCFDCINRDGKMIKKVISENE